MHSGENVELANAEVESLFSKTKRDSQVSLFETKLRKDEIISVGKRLAYIRFGAELLLAVKPENLESALSSFDWQKHYKKNFRVVADGPKPSKYYGGLIWKKLKNPKVNLSNPATDIRIVFTNNKAYVGILLWENNEDFESRKAHKRPGFAPTSIHPKLARACVNLLGIDTKKIVDPFCGTGGFLIEAGLMGLDVQGFDFDDKVLKACKENLKYFNVKKYKLQKKDALKLGEEKYIVTDLPYGKSAAASTKNIYRKFLTVLRKKLTKRAVIITLSNEPLPKGFSILYKFDYYIHKSMTKRILVLVV